MGTMLNWCQVFGRNPFLWFVPVMGKTGKPEGSGVTWLTKNGNVMANEEAAMTDEIVLNSSND